MHPRSRVLSTLACPAVCPIKSEFPQCSQISIREYLFFKNCSKKMRISIPRILICEHCGNSDFMGQTAVFEREPEFSPLRLANDPPRLSGRPRPRVVSRTSSETICGQNEKFSTSGDSGTRNAVSQDRGEGRKVIRICGTFACTLASVCYC